MVFEFETPRLRVNHWQDCLNDPQCRACLERDLTQILTPAVLRDLPDPLQLTAAQGIAQWVNDRDAESDVYILSQRADDRRIGLLILANDQDSSPRQIHLGYLLTQATWGQGYASELILGLVEKLSQHAPLDLFGGVARTNPASARVLEKAGFGKAARQMGDETVMYHLQIR